MYNCVNFQRYKHTPGIYILMDKLKQENNYETSWLCNNCTFQFLAATKRQETATPRLPYLNISRREPNSLQDSLLHKLWITNSHHYIVTYILEQHHYISWNMGTTTRTGKITARVVII